MRQSSDRLTHFLEAHVNARVFPGGVLFVRRHGDILRHQAVGTLSYSSPTFPVQTDTLYDLASLSKPLAAVSAALFLVQQSRLALDQTLDALLEETRHHPLGRRSLKTLLCHDSGLPAWRPFYLNFLPDCPGEDPLIDQRAGIIMEKILQEPLDDLAPRNTVYSDLGYMLLGWVIERVSGMNVGEFCQRQIFQPLEACSLGFRPLRWSQKRVKQELIAPTEQDAWRGRILQGEVHDENAFVMGGRAGHAGLFGTAEAVSKVTGAWLAGYLGRSDFFRTELVRQFVKAQPKTSWALGWDTPSRPSSSGTGFSPESFGHLGFTGTSIWIDPAKELEVIFLSNRVHPTRDNPAIKTFRPQLHDLILSELAK